MVALDPFGIEEIPVASLLEFGNNGTLLLTIKQKGTEQTLGGSFKVDGDTLQFALRHGDKDVKYPPLSINGLTEKELPPLIEMIKELRDSGVTVIWIEHIVHALLAVVDQLMCLAFGKVLAIGDPQDVMRSPEVIEVYLGSTFGAEEAS